MIVDLFAGGGGASTGIEAALGRRVDVAINHDAIALAVHKANHPHTRHLEADIWEVRPKDATGGAPVELLWASPDCTHFSVAKGDVPRSAGIRSLAWAVVKWAKAVRPRVICLENVREFQGWGPLGKDRKPIKAKAGTIFAAWVGQLEKLGYRVEWRVLDASAFGAPTRRKRLFVIARCDGEPIVWPEPTHGPGRRPYRTAAECIDWSLPCPSIFERERPLAEKTLWRIAEGVKRYVLESPRPFIVEMNHSNAPRTPAEPLGVVTTQHNRFNLVAPFVTKVNHGRDEFRGQRLDEPLSTVTAAQRGHAVCATTLIQAGYGERQGQAPRVPHHDKPLGTVVAGGRKHAVVAAFLAKHFGGVVGHDVERPIGAVTARDHHSLAAATLVKFRGNQENGHPGCASIEEPLPTITARGNHIAEVRAFLLAYYGEGTPGQQLLEPMRTITAKHRLGLVTVAGAEYQIVDIGMRMLEPHELLRAQFGEYASTYDLGAARTKAAKVRLIGNSVPPHLAKAIVRANLVVPAEAVAV